MSTFNPLFTRTVRAAGAIARGRCVGFDGAQIAAANARALGIAPHAALAGEDTPLVVVGTAIMEAGGAIALGAQIATDTQGRGVTWSTGAVVAEALQPATAAGQFIEVLLRA
jgi:hypothetical protein